MDTRSADHRQQRGLALATAKGDLIREIVDGRFFVPSARDSAGYIVDLAAGTCTCPDWEERGGHGREHRCKHLWAVLNRHRDLGALDGSNAVADEKKERVHYPRNWPVINRAHVEFPRVGPHLLADLVRGLPAESETPRPGRPRVPLRDIVFASLLKEFEGRPARGTVEFCERLQREGLLRRVPSYNTLLREMANPALLPILQSLIAESARPLTAIETSFATDATGFGTSVYDHWHEHKHGKGPRRSRGKAHRWIKLHFTVGTMTKIITAMQATENNVGDSPMLSELVARTHRAGFKPTEWAADKAYLSNENVRVIAAVGATPYIPFKTTSTGRGNSIMERMYFHFMTERDDFQKHYHRRVQVESAVEMLKERFGARLDTRVPSAQYAEITARCVCHNIYCLIRAILELGIEPRFWQPPAKAPDGGEPMHAPCPSARLAQVHADLIGRSPANDTEPLQ